MDKDSNFFMENIDIFIKLFEDEYKSTQKRLNKKQEIELKKEYEGNLIKIMIKEIFVFFTLKKNSK
jgi:hypothetical protein